MSDDKLHLVGSIPLASAEAVFTRISDSLGPHLCRLPDGETGERARWIYWQRTMLASRLPTSSIASGVTYPSCSCAR